MKWREHPTNFAKALWMGAARHRPCQTFPIELEVIPSELNAQIYLHDVKTANGRISCWSYVTAGLAECKQRELIFTLKRYKNEQPADYSLEPISLFRTIRNLAKEGRTVDAGDVTKLGGAQFLGFDGFTYVEPVWLPLDNANKKTWLAMIALTMDEVDAVLAFHSTRVTNILGRADSCYPTPYWNDRGRATRLSLQAMQESILWKARPAKLAGVRVFRQNKRVFLWLTHGLGDQIAELFRDQTENSPAIFAAEIDPCADGALVWLPGQDGPQAITPPGSIGQRVSGTFVMFVPEQDSDEMRIVEDGYALLLTNQTWHELRKALIEERDREIPIVCLKWVPDGFNVSIPNGDIPPETGPLRTRHIMLREPEAELQGNITIKTLAAFTRAIEETVREQLANVEAKAELRVACEIQIGAKAEYTLASRPELSASILQNLWNELQMLPVPDVRNPLRFAIDFEIQARACSAKKQSI